MPTVADANTGNSRIDSIINNILSVRLQSWRELSVYDEDAILFSKNRSPKFARFTFGNWNKNFNEIVVWNDDVVNNGEHYNINETDGILSLTSDWIKGDRIVANYNFSYFSNLDLDRLIRFALHICNSSGAPQYNFGINDAPEQWDGALSEVAYLEALRKIRLDSTVWRSFVLLRINPDEALTQISEEIDASTQRLEGMVEGMHSIKYTSKPTGAYWSSIFGAGGRYSFGGGSDVATGGRFRGYRPNRIV